MGADASIFLQGQQPVRSVSDYMGDMDLRDLRRAQLTGATQNNALQALTMDQTRQTMADTQRKQNALRMAVQSVGPNADPNQFAKTLLQNPDTMDAGVALQSHLAAIGKTQADTTESLAKAGKATQETAGGAYDLRVKKADQAFKDISAFDTPEQAMASLNQHAQAGDVDFQKASAIAQQLQAIPQGDRIAFQKWQTGMLQGILSAKEKLAETAPKPTEVRLGDRVAFIDMNPQSQTFKQEVSSARVGVSPDTAATNATSRANNRDTLAGENLRAGMMPGGGMDDNSERTAQAIASGQLPAPTGMALLNPKNQRILGRVMEINPQYDATTVSAKKAAATAFTSGTLGNALRSVSTANAHLDQMGELVDALGNGNTQIINKVSNWYQKQTGNPAPTNFDAIKAIVGQEVVKAIVAGGGGVGEREEAAKSFSTASSPQQLQGVIKHYRMVMGAQSENLLAQRDAAGLPRSTLPNYNTGGAAQSDLHDKADAILKGGK
ncbi:MAG: hypothetical protein WCP82_10185 [Alphaproteobacteria bacterium]